MKIAIYQPRASYYTGGGEVIPIQHALKLARRGHKITFITSRAPFIKETELFNRLKDQPNLSIQYIAVPDSLKWLYDQPAGQDWRRWDLESLHVGLLAREALAGQNFDLFVTHLIFDVIATPTSIPSVLHLHGYPPNFSYHHELLTSLTHDYVSVSNQVQTKWKEILPSNAHSYMVENGIDADVFIPKRLEEKYDVLYIGRLLSVKGIDTLLEAITLLPTKAKVAIAGTGPIEVELKHLAKREGLEDYVEFLGYVPENKMLDLYNSSKVVALPSKDREGVLTTLLEAASCGRPVVTTTAGSMVEFVEDGVNGRLVEPNNPKELAIAISELLANDRLRLTLAENARTKILDQWTWEDKIGILEHIYEEIIHNRRSSNE